MVKKLHFAIPEKLSILHQFFAKGKGLAATAGEDAIEKKKIED